MAATLDQLCEVRSQLAEEVLGFLHHLSGLLEATPWVRRGGERIGVTEIAIEPTVLTKEERPHRLPLKQGRNERELLEERRSPMEEIEARRYELPERVEEREELRWRQLMQRGRTRLAVKGAPGSGKSFATRYTVIELACSAAERLRQWGISVDQVDIAIWVTTQALAQASARDIVEALKEALEQSLPGLKVSRRVSAWLLEALESGRALVIVDALDELLPADRAGIETRTRQLDGLRGRVLVTCRTLQWDERRGWLGWDYVTEVELVPLQLRQQREFLRKFFTESDELRQRTDHLLQTNVAVQHTTTTPLLLTFACLLHEDRLVNEGTRSAQLYAHIVRKMLSGQWRGVKPSWSASEVKEEKCLQLLEGIVWELFRAAPEQNRFTLSQWEQAAKVTSKNRAELMLPISTLEELQQVGFVVSAGFDNRWDRCWSFAHRSLLEYLAAKGLSRHEGFSWVEEAEKHFWFQPEWLEVVTFLAGLVDDATPLIKAVGERQDDLFGSMLALKARLIGAARQVEPRLVNEACIQLVAFWKKTLTAEGSTEFSFSMFASLAQHPEARRELVESVWKLRCKDEYGFNTWVEVLGWIGTQEALEHLLELTHDEHWDVRLSAVKTLSRIGGERALERLLQLMRHWDPDVRSWAADGLAQIGDERVLKRLLELTLDKDFDKREVAVRALAQIGCQQAVERLLELTREEDRRMRAFAAYWLGRIGGEQALKRLLQLTGDEDVNVRGFAAKALGQVGDEQALERLLQLSRDEERDVRASAAGALGEVGDEQALEHLLQLTRDKDSYMRWSAADALGWIGSPHAEGVCLS
jgi:HEAT repeat protein